ncbi:carbohydrate kinase family protein [Amycolatopsis acidicola]|uniref:carbohydrate kinase family protein n=1 Tax=Amycolatopsis acidicola TaxID=2596893 RepID=UPI00140B42FA|nr:carbohydrate kinase family protein [Amycolatopsis acidicola]
MIAFCGYANSDLTVSVPVLPGAADRVQATAVDRRDGGMGANAAVAAARMEAETRFAGVVGEDPASDAFLAVLNAEGIDTSWTARTGMLTTAVVLLTPDGERSIISQDDAVTAAHIGRVADATAAADGLLYLDGYRFPAAAEALARTGVTSIVDLDGCEDPYAAREALTLARHVIVGRDQAARLFGGTDLAALAVECRVHLTVTAGALGWWLHSPGGETHHEPALEVTVVDATGAGDCFTGTYCAELDRGADPLAAARFAGVAAGLSCTRPGARAGSPRRSEVLPLLRRFPTSEEEKTCAGQQSP